MSLTVVIITLNEEKDIPQTLKSAAFADEVLVVDSGSTDQTIQIARSAGAKVISHPFTSYAQQRNFADKHAKGEWVLSIDADVEIPVNLATEIKTQITNPESPISAFYIGRQNEIWGKVINHADWGPKDDCHLRLYKKRTGLWQSQVHEQFVTTQPTGKLKSFLFHHNYRSVGEFINKTDHYSELAARQKKQITWFTPLYDFLKRYFYKLGFLDGYRGLFLSYLQAIYHINLKIKLWQKSYT